MKVRFLKVGTQPALHSPRSLRAVRSFCQSSAVLVDGERVDLLVGQICAKFRPNCLFSVKSMKFGTETVSKMTKKTGYGDKPEIAVLPS